MTIGKKLTGALLACAGISAPVLADPVSLDSAVYVERLDGGNRSLEPASRLNRGDRVVTILTWHRDGGSNGFTLTNPLPPAISYQASARDNAELSVDGGRSWGQIGTLRLGSRLATAEDVTHVRWRVPAGRSGQIAYSGIVR